MKGKYKLRKKSDKIAELYFTIVIFLDSVLCVLDKKLYYSSKSERD